MSPPEESRPRAPEKPRDWAWADLMRRVFDLDVLACPRCGGRMSVIATIEAGDVMRKILGHLGLPNRAAEPPPGPPASAGRRPFFLTVRLDGSVRHGTGPRRSVSGRRPRAPARPPSPRARDRNFLDRPFVRLVFGSGEVRRASRWGLPGGGSASDSRIRSTSGLCRGYAPPHGGVLLPAGSPGMAWQPEGLHRLFSISTPADHTSALIEASARAVRQKSPRRTAVLLPTADTCAPRRPPDTKRRGRLHNSTRQRVVVRIRTPGLS